MFVSTDDGSLGFQGFITNLLETKLDRWYLPANTKITLPVLAYVCGPEVMEAAAVSALSKYTQTKLIQVSIERMMKCGVGICSSCEIDGSRSCIDGPVYSAEYLMNGNDFGRFHRNKYGARVRIN